MYVVSAGELGTNASALDAVLNKMFSVAPVWDAVVLIDEADVFLEERSTADIEHNAMVSVFLRQIEQVLTQIYSNLYRSFVVSGISGGS